MAVFLRLLVENTGREHRQDVSSRARERLQPLAKKGRIIQGPTSHHFDDLDNSLFTRLLLQLEGISRDDLLPWSKSTVEAAWASRGQYGSSP